MSWASFISAGVGTWTVKGATALGLGLVTYAGFSAIKNAAASAVTGALGNLGGGAYQVLALAGFVDAVGIWLGALTTMVTLLSFKRFGVLTG